MAEKPQTAKELRGLTEAELVAQLDALRRERWQAGVDASTGSLQQLHRIRLVRRQMARVLTILRERNAPQARRPQSP